MAYKIETLPSGSKRIRIYYTDENGNYKTKSVTGKTEKEVLTKAIEFDNTRRHIEASDDITVGKAIQDYIDLNAMALSPTTVDQYRSMLRNRFDMLKNIPVDSLTDRVVQNWINFMIRKGLSPKSIKNTYNLMTPAIERYTTYKPRVTLPQTEEFIHTYPEDYEVDQIIEASKGTTFEIPLLLAALGGMRMSEIRGLKWSDIKDDYIIVQRAKIRVAGEDEVKTTKSRSGTRMLPIFGPIREALNRTERSGEYVIDRTAKSIKVEYHKILKSLGLPLYRFHDLRHHAASVGAKLGIPDDYMRQYVGHSTVNMLKRYQHQMKTATSEFAGQLDKYYSGKASK